jgi:hypothetical protein
VSATNAGYATARYSPWLNQICEAPHLGRALQLAQYDNPNNTRLDKSAEGKESPMANRPIENPERQMPVHVEAAYKDAVDNIIFLNRQQWVATNYAPLLYAAIFVISAEYGFTGPTSTESSRLAWVCRSGHNHLGPNSTLPPGLSLSHSSDLC